jgi:hypothetical protein
MIRKPIPGIGKTQIDLDNTYEAEPLEVKLRRKERGGKIDEEEGDGKTWAVAYTERKDGVLPEYDIRTDRFEVAREAQDRLNQGIMLQYSDRQEAEGAKEVEEAEKDGETETR